MKEKKLTSEQKRKMRVKIAKDVLLQLEMKKLIPKHMTYTGNLDRLVPFGEDGQEVLLSKNTPPCEACALGAGFLALIRLEDQWKGGDIRDVHNRMRKYFTDSQVNVLENLFENFGYDDRQLSAVPARERLEFLYSFVVKRKGRFTKGDIRRAAAAYAKKH